MIRISRLVLTLAVAALSSPAVAELRPSYSTSSYSTTSSPSVSSTSVSSDPVKDAIAKDPSQLNASYKLVVSAAMKDALLEKHAKETGGAGYSIGEISLAELPPGSYRVVAADAPLAAGELAIRYRANYDASNSTYRQIEDVYIGRAPRIR